MGQTETVGRKPERASGSRAQQTLRAQLAVEPDPDSNCDVLEQRDSTKILGQSFKLPQSCFEEVEKPTDCTPAACGECHVKVPHEDTSSDMYLISDVHEKCICPVFDEHDCIPDIKGIRSGSLVIVVTVRNRTILRELLTDLRDVEASISIEWLTNADEGESTTEIETNDITEKQRKALETALEAGYYDTPRETSLTELAEGLKISKSAVSQRLNAAETKLVEAFLQE